MKALEEYGKKRDFEVTSEPGPHAARGHAQPIFVVQEHDASRLHYDFRLEADGVLKSWAVPKEPSMDPGDKRLAVQVEDHPLDYANFEGDIPEGQYGAGHVEIWDHGTYENLMAEKAVPQSVTEGIDAGKLEFVLHGKKLRGQFALVCMHGRGRGKDNWLLIKMKDQFARPEDGTPDKRAASTARKPAAGTRTGSRALARTSGRRSSSSPAVSVQLTHGDRVIYPDIGATKADVFDFYQRIADRLLPFLRDRPITLERLPDGLASKDAPHFWQKDTPAHYPNWIPRAELPTDKGKIVHYALANDVTTLLYLVNQGTLTFHVWLSRVQQLDRPDFVLFDLDVGQAAFADAVAVAHALRDTLRKHDIEPVLKTSGKAGLHVLMPWSEAGDYDRARAWAHGVAGTIAQAMPEQATVEIRKAKRGRRVYIDTLQNARGHHAVPPYVLRAVPAASVSTPLAWRELTPDLDPKQFNIKTIFRRLSRQKADPMKPLLDAIK
jgi:bifunctional non-homologous end joining protein LigD